MGFLYTIRFFGKLRVRRLAGPGSIEQTGGARSADQRARGFPDIDRFRTQKTGALIAYLGFFGDRIHPREELTEVLWPEIPPVAARHNLSMALSSLRSQFEGSPIQPGAVFYADRNHLGITGLVTTDVARFEQMIDSAARLHASSPERTELLTAAVELYRGQLLPGSYESWIAAQHERLAARWREALLWLAEDAAASGHRLRGIRYARRAAESDPLDEEAQSVLERLDDRRRPDTRPAMAPAAARAGARLDLPSRPPLLRMVDGESETPTGVTPAADSDDVAVLGASERDARASTETTEPAAPFVSPLIVPLTQFYGREWELREINHLLGTREVRLITIVGSGGVGKTRLSREAVHRGDDAPKPRRPELVGPGTDTRGRATFATDNASRLRGIVDASLVPSGDTIALLDAICTAIGVSRVTLSDEESCFAAIAAGLRRTSRPLLLFDNFEEALPVGAETMATLIGRIPDLTCLVTSRSRLGIAGESAIDLGPLPVPPAVANVESDEMDLAPFVARWASVALFVDRARQVRPDFALKRRNIRSVAQVVRFLDGLPLALELAAVRVQLLTPAALLARLRADRFDVLTGSGRRFVKRHTSLQSILAWSVDFLAPDTRQFFAPLCVFRGGFTLEDAEALTGSTLALDFMAQLCDACLVRATGPETADANSDSVDLEDDAVPVRFHLLETVRAFADTVLPAGERETARARHAEIFVRMAQDSGPRLEGGNPAFRLDRLDEERANLRAALDWLLQSSGRVSEAAVSTGAASIVSEPRLAALHLASDLYRYWWLRGGPLEGRRWLSAAVRATAPDLSAVALSDADGGPRAILIPAAELERLPTQSDGRRLVDAAVWAAAVNRLGILEMTMGDTDAAERSFADALTLRRLMGQTAGIAMVLGNLAILAVQRRDFASARAGGEEALRLWRQLGNEARIANTLANLGALANESGDFVAAEAMIRASTAQARLLGNVHAEAVGRGNLGEVLMRVGRLGEAEVELRAALNLSSSLKAAKTIADNLLDLALLRAWTITYPEEADALARRLRSTARLCLAALGIPRSPSVEDQELRSFGPWEDPAADSRPATLAAADPPGPGLDVSYEAEESRIIEEQTLAAAMEAAMALARELLSGPLWFTRGE